MAVSTLIQELKALKNELKELTEQEKNIRAAITERETALLDKLDDLGVNSLRSTDATVSITEQEVNNVEDWDEFYAFIHQTKAYYLLQRRPANAACNEQRTLMGGTIPGIKPATIRKISLYPSR